MFIYVDGPAQLYIGAQNCEASAYTAPGNDSRELGITESGVQVSYQTMTHRVNSDDCGGGEGNPAEILVMGAQGTIRGTMVKYNPNAVGDLMSGLYGLSNGGVRLPGTAIFANNYGIGFWIIGNNISYYFPKCEMATTPREFNVSTTERKTSFTINAYPVMSSASALALFFTGAGATDPYYPGCVGVSGSGDNA